MLVINSERVFPGGYEFNRRARVAAPVELHLQPVLGEQLVLLGDVEWDVVCVRKPLQQQRHFLKFTFLMAICVDIKLS